MAINEVSLMVAWMDPVIYAPMIREYIIRAVSNRHDRIMTVPAGQRDVNITDLVPTFSYNVSVVVTYNVNNFMSDPVTLTVTLPECEG